MSLKSFFPMLAKNIKYQVANHKEHGEIEHNIPLNVQCSYAESVLRMTGLTKNFAPVVLFCGHGSETENNAYATALDCGACGGHDGALNAKIIAGILNNRLVREFLNTKGIYIESKTIFLAALHNTTTDEITIYETRESKSNPVLSQLVIDLERARNKNCDVRLTSLSRKHPRNSKKVLKRKSVDWSETRPEWGLAKNAGFIIAPRELTKNINLQGRAFLHSYDWTQDETGQGLTTIMTAPMVVAQWINCQYLFSTIDNKTYGSGSKVTHNITGKIGVLQGNASDLMHGLPLQSIALSDNQRYHLPARLHTFILAPKSKISGIIQNQEVLQRLFGNNWVHLLCLDPNDKHTYILEQDFSWRMVSA
jgi:hypothetical protein